MKMISYFFLWVGSLTVLFSQDEEAGGSYTPSPEQKLENCKWGYTENEPYLPRYLSDRARELTNATRVHARVQILITHGVMKK